MDAVKLYYENAYTQDFTAVVQSCEAVKNGFAVTLDRTAFYPEGGGQPADHGTLGEARVLDVHEKDGVVTHLCDRALSVGAEVGGRIDWARRFDHMQQHSGEHIISGLLCSTFHCDNVGFHMGADVVTIDYNAPITWEQALEVERRANAYIWADHPIRIWYPSAEELAALPYRSKKELTGAVRNHDPEIMIKAFELVRLGEEDVKKKFPAMYNAFCYGAPPHAGIAPGVDRMVMLLAGESSIREIIPFPMNQNAQDIMMGAPSTVEQKQLDELHIAIVGEVEKDD